MAKRYQPVGDLSRLDRRDARNSQHVALRQLLITQRTNRGRRHSNEAAGDCDPLLDRLCADIDHAGGAFRIKVGKF